MLRSAVRWPRAPAFRRAPRMRRCGRAGRRPTIRIWLPAARPRPRRCDLLRRHHRPCARPIGRTTRRRRSSALDGSEDACHGDDRRERRRVCADADGGGPAAGGALAAACWVAGCGSCSIPTARDRALVEVGESLKEVGRTVRQRAPRARVLFVDYLTLLPPAGAGRLAAVGRRRGARPPRRRHARAADGRSRRGDRLRTGAGGRGQPRASRVVGGPVDDQADEIRPAGSRPSRSRAPQRGGHARRGRPGH